MVDAIDYAVAVTHTLVGTRNLVNEARWQYTVHDQTVNALDPTCPLPCTAESQGGPTLIVVGIGVAGRQLYTPAPRVARRFQAVDALSYDAGSHQVKTGFDFSAVDTNTRRASRLRRPVRLRAASGNTRHHIRADLCNPGRGPRYTRLLLPRLRQFRRQPPVLGPVVVRPGRLDDHVERRREAGSAVPSPVLA